MNAPLTTEPLFYVIERAHGKLRFRVTDNLWTRDASIAALNERHTAEIIAEQLNKRHRDEQHWCSYEAMRKI